MDSQLRRAQRNYYADPICDNWVKWLSAARSIGQPFFTSEGLALATQGTVLSFQETIDGFRAEVKDATQPHLRLLTPISHEDKEYMEYHSWTGTIYLECADESLDPSIIIDANACYQPPQDYLNLGWCQRSFVWVYYKVFNDAQLLAACQDSRHIPIDGFGWDNG